MEHEFYECPEYLSNTTADVERIVEYEYEVQSCIIFSVITLKSMCYIFSNQPLLGTSSSHLTYTNVFAKRKQNHLFVWTYTKFKNEKNLVEQ